MSSLAQLKEEEVRELREALEAQKEAARRREEELLATAQQMVGWAAVAPSSPPRWSRVEVGGDVSRCLQVEDAVEQQRRRGEEAVQVHAGMLKEQHREALERAGAETEKERRHALTLQNTVLELQQVRTDMTP